MKLLAETQAIFNRATFSASQLHILRHMKLDMKKLIDWVMRQNRFGLLSVQVWVMGQNGFGLKDNNLRELSTMRTVTNFKKNLSIFYILYHIIE